MWQTTARVIVALAQGWPNYGLRAASSLPNNIHIFSSNMFLTVDSSAMLLHCKLHCIQPSSGQAVTNSVLKSKISPPLL